MRHCFELFGLDFMVDEQFNVHILEVNPGPDFKQTGNRLKIVIDNLLDGTCNIVIDDRTDAPSLFTKVYEKEWSVAKLDSGMTLS